MASEHSKESFTESPVLIVPEFGEFGGTLTFLRSVLEACALDDSQQQYAFLVSRTNASHPVINEIRAAGWKLDYGPDRSSLFFKRYFSILFDIFFLWRSVRNHRPQRIFLINGSPGTMLGAYLFRVPVTLVLLTSPLWPLKPLLRRLWKRATQRSGNRVVADSRFSARKFTQNVGVATEAISVVHNAYNLEGQARNRVGGRLQVTTLGHVEDYKAPDIWLEVAERVVAWCPEVDFLWLGSGRGLRTLRQQISKRGLAERVFAPGFDANVRPYYESSTIYFQPSRRESHGIAVVDALAFGLPVVTSDAGGLPETNIHGVTGMICPMDDVECFARSLATILTDETLRKKFGKAARLRAEQAFGPESHRRKLLELLHGGEGLPIDNNAEESKH